MTKTTSPQALKNAARYLANGIRRGSDKVSAVRALAAWKDSDGTKLARRDVFELIHNADLDIADATISTQFQRVRSGAIRVMFG
jgi:hypothetical protein